MATGPKVARTPLEVFENRGTSEPPFLNKFWAPGVAGLVGFLAVVGGNWGSRKPYFSGIQRHIGVTAVAAYIGKVVDDYRLQYYAERDAVFRHYVELHPEDFPPFRHEKFADLFEPWIPIR